MNGIPVADMYPRIRAGRDYPDQPGCGRDAPDCQPAVRKLGASSQSGPCCGFRKLRPNWQRFHHPVVYLNGSAKKAGEHLDSVATGGEAEPSPPWHVCPGYAFTQPPPKLRYGAGFARQTFVPRFCLRQRAGCLRTAPRIRCPLRAGARTSPAQAAMTTSPKPISWMGRPHYPAAFSRGGQHVASCIKVYVLRVSMKHQSKKSALKRGDVERRVRLPCPQKGGR